MSSLDLGDRICVCGAAESEHGGTQGWCPANHEDAAFSTKQTFFAAACQHCKGTGSRVAETDAEYIRATCESCNGSGFATNHGALEMARKVTSRLVNYFLTVGQLLTVEEKEFRKVAGDEVAALIQSAMNAAMKQKELGVIEHFKNAVSDGCVCGVCEAVRDAMNAQERETLDLLRRFVRRFSIKPASDVCTVCKCRFEHSSDCLVAAAERLLAERGEGR